MGITAIMGTMEVTVLAMATQEITEIPETQAITEIPETQKIMVILETIERVQQQLRLWQM